MANRMDHVVEEILNRRRVGERILVAVAGPPATGKSTFSEALLKALNGRDGHTLEACVVPMDGFHLDNAQLDHLGVRQHKGAPSTFDFDGFRCLLERVRNTRVPIYYPVFDRARDTAIAGAGVVTPETEVVVVEGNYLMLDEEPWTSLAPLFDLEIFLGAPMASLESRLIRRWLDHGYDLAGAKRRARSNDVPNAMLVLNKARASDRALIFFAGDDLDPNF